MMSINNKIISKIKKMFHLFLKFRRFKILLKNGRAGLIYKENGKSLFVDSEILATKNCIAIYKKTELFWNHPFENDTISAYDRDRIYNNIITYFKEKGWHVDEVLTAISPSEQNKVICDTIISFREKGLKVSDVVISSSGPNNHS